MSDKLNPDTLQERVNAICNELYSQGTKVSVRLVLSMIPEVNSTSTIHKYFAKWKDELEASQKSLYDKLGFSSTFTKSFMEEISRFSVEAEQRYKNKADSAIEQRDEALDEMEKIEDKYIKQTAVLEQKLKVIAELEKELQITITKSQQNIEKERESTQAVLKELRQQLNESKASNQALIDSNESLRTEVAKAELRLEGNEKYVNEVKQQSLALIAENKAASTTIATLNKEIASQEATLKGNHQLIRNLTEQQESLRASLAQAEQSRQQTNNELVSMRKDLDVAKTHVDELKTQLNSENKQVNELKVALTEQVRTTDKTISNYESTLTGNHKLIEQLELANAAAREKIAQLEQEKDKLSDNNRQS
ncbi:hypothetical protein K6Y31_20375 [Motilimonas cestriensis]|uniref:KfrA N-terminal DNA-binding domain-containing protein n=1 Tax=Motilimonas cestriensis TaxID=2742685 RepID=A0ABS8WEY8_9GAMM|nr:DNA-binding protein [Motilimonas cestriensis]MCE2597133.1 hypothetical protein [Motilimonas cestriensis]